MSSSSSVNSLYSSTSRLTGLFSDLDTDSIVKDLCSTQQSKIDKEYQEKTTNEWKQDALNEISDAVKNVSNTYCSVLGTSSMLKNSNYTSYKTTTSDTSGAVSLTASFSAFDDNVKISVQQLAENASVSSGSISKSVSNTLDTSATLADLDLATPLTTDDSGNVSFTINGKAFSFSSDTTLNSMMSTINADTDAAVTMSYSASADSFTIASDVDGADITIANSSGNCFGEDSAFGIGEGTVNQSVTSSSTVSRTVYGELSSKNTATLGELNFATPLTAGSDGNISFKINGTKFSFSTDTTLQSMINTINTDSDAGVTMKYSRLTDSFTITADDGGADSSVSIENISGNAFGTDSAFGIAEGTTKNGQNAKVTINGVTVTENSNNFSIDGLTYELNDTTTQDISFKVERDYSASTDAVQSFVDALNTLITTVTGYTDADDNSLDYPPLTESQKDDMTEDQIEKWETKAKSGILRNDSTLESLVTNIKNAFFSSAGGTGQNATSIGITTASYFDENSGELQLDTDALKEALASDPDTVISIFTGGSSTANSENQGVVYKIKSALGLYLDISDDTLDTISNNLDKIDDTMDTMEDKLSDMADKYYEKFSNMETALSKLNSQSNMLSSMFSS